MRLYCTLQEVLDIVLLDVEDDFAPSIENWILQISKYIETFTDRIFEIESDLFEDRVFDGNGKYRLLIDECVAINSVSVDGSEITFKSYPANKTPKFQLFSETGFYPGNQNVTVNAMWGYSEEAPEDIRFACAVLVAGIIMNQTKTEGATLREQIGNYEVAYRDEKEFSNFMRAKDILQKYKRISI